MSQQLSFRDRVSNILGGTNSPQMRRIASLENQLQQAKQVSSQILEIRNQQTKTQIPTNPISYRQNYSSDGGEIISFHPEAYDYFISSMLENSTARPMLQARKQELTRNGMELKSKFGCKCPVCNIDYEQIVEECIECGNTEDNEPFILPSEKEKEIGEEWIQDNFNINNNRQNIYDICEMTLEFVDITDDSWWGIEYEYIHRNGYIFDSEPKEVWVIHPGNMAWSVDKNNKIGKHEYTCIEHRDYAIQDPDGYCIVDNCGNILYPVMAVRYKPGTQEIIMRYIPNEILHGSLHRPSALNGYPPAITLQHELSLTTNQMRYMAAYYNDVNYHKVPGYLLLPTSKDWEQVWKESKEMRRELEADPFAIGILPYDPNSAAKPEFVRFDTTPREMEFIPTRDEARGRMSAFYGVSPIIQADNSAGGGLNNEGLQFTVTNRAVSKAQQFLNRKFLTPLSEAIGLKDWVIALSPNEEQDKVAELDLKIKEAQYGEIMMRLGFGVKLDVDHKIQIIERQEGEDPYADLFNQYGQQPEPLSQSQPMASDNLQGAPNNQQADVGLQKMKFYYKGGVILCDEHKEAFKNTSIKYTNSMTECNYPGCKNSMPEDKTKMESIVEPYDFTMKYPDWQWKDDYNLREFRIVPIEDINVHPDFEITEEDIKKGSPRVRAGTIIYYLTEATEMDPLVVDPNINVLDGHHRLYVLKKREQQAVMIAIVEPKEKEEVPDLSDMKVKQQMRAPKGGVTIQGTFYAGGKFIPKEVVENMTEDEKQAVEEGTDSGSVDSVADTQGQQDPYTAHLESIKQEHMDYIKNIQRAIDDDLKDLEKVSEEYSALWEETEDNRTAEDDDKLWELAIKKDKIEKRIERNEKHNAMLQEKVDNPTLPIADRIHWLETNIDYAQNTIKNYRYSTQNLEFTEEQIKKGDKAISTKDLLEYYDQDDIDDYIDLLGEEEGTEQLWTDLHTDLQSDKNSLSRLQKEVKMYDKAVTDLDKYEKELKILDKNPVRKDGKLWGYFKNTEMKKAEVFYDTPDNKQRDVKNLMQSEMSWIAERLGMELSEDHPFNNANILFEPEDYAKGDPNTLAYVNYKTNTIMINLNKINSIADTRKNALQNVIRHELAHYVADWKQFPEYHQKQERYNDLMDEWSESTFNEEQRREVEELEQYLMNYNTKKIGDHHHSDPNFRGGHGENWQDTMEALYGKRPTGKSIAGHNIPEEEEN